MTTRTLLIFAVGVIAAGTIWQVATRFSTNGPDASKPAVSASAAATPSTTKKGANTLAVEQDKAQVFQRAFWRRPGAGDKILHAERRDWTDAGAAVQKWQWFVAVAPSPEFRRWLLEDNPFELATVAAGAAVPEVENPPAWFPPKEALMGMKQYRNRGGYFVVFHDPQSGRIFAADAGAGFAAAVR